MTHDICLATPMCIQAKNDPGILFWLNQDFIQSLLASNICIWFKYILDAVGLSRILKGKQKLGLTFDSDKLGVIDFTKLSKLTTCRA